MQDKEYPTEDVNDTSTRLIPLGVGKGNTQAEQVKSLGLRVGDIIRGKEDAAASRFWHEVRLTVLWIGAEKVIYRKQWRSSRMPEAWLDTGEVSNFTLTCREYFLETAMDETSNAEHATRISKQEPSCWSRGIFGWLVRFHYSSEGWWITDARGYINMMTLAYTIIKDATGQKARRINVGPLMLEWAKPSKTHK
jgi:hypothetical protein